MTLSSLASNLVRCSSVSPQPFNPESSWPMKPNPAIIPRFVRFPILLCQLLALCAAGALLSSVAQAAAFVTTDQPDYPPGATAYITASGFQVGETVSFQVLHADGTPSAKPNSIPPLTNNVFACRRT